MCICAYACMRVCVCACHLRTTERLDIRAVENNTLRRQFVDVGRLNFRIVEANVVPSCKE